MGFYKMLPAELIAHAIATDRASFKHYGLSETALHEPRSCAVLRDWFRDRALNNWPFDFPAPAQKDDGTPLPRAFPQLPNVLYDGELSLLSSPRDRSHAQTPQARRYTSQLRCDGHSTYMLSVLNFAYRWQRSDTYPVSE